MVQSGFPPYFGHPNARGPRDRARVPLEHQMDGSALRPGVDRAGAPCAADRVLRLLPNQLVAHPALHAGVARPLWGLGPEDRGHPFTRLLVRPRPGRGGARTGTARDPLPGRPRSRPRAVADLPQSWLARALSLRPHRRAQAHALRGGRVRCQRAGDPRLPAGDRQRARAARPDGAAAAGGRAGRPARAPNRRHHASGGARPRRARARLDGGIRLHRGRRRRRRRDRDASARARPTWCCRATEWTPGSTRQTARWWPTNPVYESTASSSRHWSRRSAARAGDLARRKPCGSPWAA